MICVVVLLYLDLVIFEPQHSSFVIINVTIVWCTEDCDNSWELSWTIPLMQFIAIHLHLMRSYYTQEIIGLKEVVGSCVSKEVRAVSLVVLFEFSILETSLVLNWIAPHEISEESNLRNFLKPVKLIYRLDIMKFWTDTSMHSQNLIINESSKWQIIERLHHHLINLYIILILDLYSEIEVLSHLPALMIASQQSD